MADRFRVNYYALLPHTQYIFICNAPRRTTLEVESCELLLSAAESDAADSFTFLVLATRSDSLPEEERNMGMTFS